MGLPPEVTQAKVRAEMKELHGVAPDKPPVPEPYNPRVFSEPPKSPEPTAVLHDKGAGVVPLTSQQLFDAFPDEDLVALAKKYMRIDGRWGRERIIGELIKLGVDPKAVLNSPPPPPPPKEE